MEAGAPHGAPAPQRPRNLAPPLAAWLRRHGFTATEQEHGGAVTVRAHWLSPAGDRFQLVYQWSAQRATLSLVGYLAGMQGPLELVSGQHVRRLREARQLLHNDVRFRAAWQAAKGQPLSQAI